LIGPDADGSRVAAPLTAHEVGAADHAVSNVEGVDARADLADLAREVDADHQRLRADEAVDQTELAPLAHLPVDRVDADGAHLDANLAATKRTIGQLHPGQRLLGVARGEGLHRNSRRARAVSTGRSVTKSCRAPGSTTRVAWGIRSASSRLLTGGMS